MGDTMEEYLRELCISIGERPVGSKNNKRATSYVEGLFYKQGLEVDLQTFPCIDWENGGAKLHLLGRRLPIVPAPYSNPCHIEASSVLIGTQRQLREKDLKGKIAIIHGELGEVPLMPINFPFYNPKRDKDIIALLKEKGPEALITISPTQDYVPLIEDGDFPIPCGIVSKGVGLDLLKLEGALLKLIINTKRIPSTGSNIIAYVNREITSPWAFTAHLDTKYNTPGALDNGGGVTVLLALGERLKGRKDVGAQLIIFNGEDYYSSPGQVTYLASHSFQGLRGAINCDGVGLKEDQWALSFMNCPEPMMEEIVGLGEKYRDFQLIEPWPQGDHMIFVMKGIPVMAITSKGIFEILDRVIHTERDTFSLLDLDILRQVVFFLEELALLK